MRTAELTLNHQSAAKAIVVGGYIANNAGTDGVCVRLQWYREGFVLATVRKTGRVGDQIKSTDRHIIIQGDLECEVMTEAEKVKFKIAEFDS